MQKLNFIIEINLPGIRDWATQNAPMTDSEFDALIKATHEVAGERGITLTPSVAEWFDGDCARFEESGFEDDQEAEPSPWEILAPLLIEANLRIDPKPTIGGKPFEIEPTYEATGSLWIERNLQGRKLREVANNGKTGDRAITLYEDTKGFFLAVTNGDPIFEADFNDEGATSVEEAASLIQSWEHVA